MPDQDILSDAERAALSEAMQAQALPALQALLVDDDRDSLNLLCEILNWHGVACVTEQSAEAALGRLAVDRSIGLLITDLRMHPVNGLELIRRIRESDRAALPIIIMSGDAGVKDAIEAMHLSVVDFLLKPIDSAQLVELAKKELGLN
ncbi:MAG: response regulator [Pseudomonas sp.]|nr:response regulator [Pseudomonas sp.]